MENRTKEINKQLNQLLKTVPMYRALTEDWYEEKIIPKYYTKYNRALKEHKYGDVADVKEVQVNFLEDINIIFLLSIIFKVCPESNLEFKVCGFYDMLVAVEKFLSTQDEDTIKTLVKQAKKVQWKYGEID